MCSGGGGGGGGGRGQVGGSGGRGSCPEVQKLTSLMLQTCY